VFRRTKGTLTSDCNWELQTREEMEYDVEVIKASVNVVQKFTRAQE